MILGKRTASLTSQRKPMHLALDAGGRNLAGDTAAGRRVLLPWGGSGFTYATLHANGKELLKRSLAWAATSGGSSGEPLIKVAYQIQMSNSAQLKPYTGGTLVVATNTTSNDKVDLKNDAVISGSLDVGVGGDPADVIKLKNSARITGSLGTLSSALSFPTNTAPSVGSSLGNVTYSSDHLITADRRYDDLKLQSSARVTVRGDITIVCDGKFEAKNASKLIIEAGSSLKLYVDESFELKNDAEVNVQDGDADRMTLYVTGDDEVTLKNDAAMYASIDAPESKLSIKNGAVLYGVFSGDQLEMKNAAVFHVNTGGSAPEASAEPAGYTYQLLWTEMDDADDRARVLASP